MQTCCSLREHGFISIRMIEVRRRPFDAKFVQLESADIGRKRLKHQRFEYEGKLFEEEYNEIAGTFDLF